MRQVTIDCKSYNTAKNRFPWAAIIAKVEGGYTAFESLDDYRRWKTNCKMER